MRHAQTWEEAHQTVVEQYDFHRETLALEGGGRAGGWNASIGGIDDYDGGRKKGKGKGKNDSGKGGPGVCFDMREKGTSSRGDGCRL